MGNEKNNEWKRQAVATCNVQITLKSAPAVRTGYLSVSKNLEVPRHLMSAGYHDQRREWLGVIADALKKGLPIPERDFLEAVAMLKKIADGETPAKAFGLSNVRGRKNKMERLVELRKIAETVFRYNQEGHPLSKDDNSNKTNAKISAYRLAAANHDVNDSRAREAWELFGETLKQFYAGDLWEEPLPCVAKLKRKSRLHN